MVSGETFEQSRQQALDAFAAELALWGGTANLPELFWRDDDVTRVVPSLERFLALSDRRRIPIVFAAIPTQLTHGAAQVICSSAACRISMHGFAHENHAPAGDPDNEYPEGRNPDVVLDELREGRRLIMSKAGARYLNMFVPPWGRFDRGFDVMLRRAGILSFSGNATSPRHDVPLQHDCHILTEHGKAALALEVVLGRATRHLEIRRTGILPRLQPIGVMTHHRMFTPELDAVLEEFLEIVQTAGLRFSDFAVIDAAMNRTEAPVVSHSRPPSGAPASTRAAAAAQPVSQSLRALSQQLLAPTLPSVAAGLIGLPQVLSELARTSPISALRYAHLVELVAALPAGSRVLSAGCGKGLSELALAIGFPEVTWVGVDVDSTRYRNAQELGRSVDATSISFVQADLDQLDSAALGQFDAIMVSEVAMYLREPARVLKELASLLRPGGVLTCIEPFVADSDPTVLEKLRQHTQSIHGGFSHEQMASFVDGLTLVHHGNAYYGESFTLVHQLWDHMSATQNWGLVDLLFALARLDLDGSKVDSRRDATAVKVVARRDA